MVWWREESLNVFAVIQYFFLCGEYHTVGWNLVHNVSAYHVVIRNLLKEWFFEDGIICCHQWMRVIALLALVCQIISSECYWKRLKLWFVKVGMSKVDGKSLSLEDFTTSLLMSLLSREQRYWAHIKLLLQNRDFMVESGTMHMSLTPQNVQESLKSSSMALCSSRIFFFSRFPSSPLSSGQTVPSIQHVSAADRPT